MSRRLRLAIVLAIAIPLIAAGAAQALPQRTSSGPVLSAGDANDLAQTLADATAIQHVCYGWIVNVNDSSGGPSGTDAGSNKDPNSADPALSCSKYVVLRASVDYTCDSCSSNDSATYSIESNLPNPPTPPPRIFRDHLASAEPWAVHFEPSRAPRE